MNDKDMFAMAAMQALIINGGLAQIAQAVLIGDRSNRGDVVSGLAIYDDLPSDGCGFDDYADIAYEMADEMIKRRDEGPKVVRLAEPK